ncbi:MAG: DcaP family trimeric outer membrane transporter [Sedimentisphaerales bacterium]|nr:DcaP family trimeric outer membrane transporter [Sedimentisphaerales bacterium]
MSKTKILIITLALLAIPAASFAASSDKNKLADENTELRQRVEKLEKELAELKKIVLQQAQTKTPAETQPELLPKLSDIEIQKIAAIIQQDISDISKKKPLWSGLDIELYGYIKADTSYDTSRVNPGNYIVWVDSEATNDNDNEFNMTANQTRLGLKIKGPMDEGIETSGLIEVDFYGGGDENKAHLRMRHAYLKIDWPEERFNIIAGQTWDVVSPLYPSTLNFTILWDGGNIGYRHPQIRLTKSFALNDDVDLKLEGALSRTIGDDELVTTAGAKSGEDSGFPTLQGRTSLKFPLLSYKPTEVGFSGHYGEEEYGSRDLDTWSLNLDLTQPVNKWLTIKGEMFKGENLDNYLGGIGQGVRNATTTADNEIGSKGGWVAATLGPWEKWRFNIGAGIDDVDADDVNAGARTLNRSVFGNVIYSLNKNTEIGLELSHWRTDYKGPGDAEDFRAQTSFIYKF